jgi:hypothetical protein
MTGRTREGTEVTKREIAGFACRMVSVYAVLTGVVRLPELAGAFWETQTRVWAWVVSLGGPGVLQVVLGVLLWLFADRLAGSLVPDNESPGPRVSARAREFLMAGLCVLGAVVLVRGAEGLAGSVARLVAEVHHLQATVREAFLEGFQPYEKARLVSDIAGLLLGAALVIWSRELTDVLARVRKSRRREAPERTE